MQLQNIFHGHRLSDFTIQGHQHNHFNLLRMVAAMMVLVSHSVAIATGRTELEPLRQWLGLTLGSIAVDVFFVISGFLVTQSLERQASVKAFVRARALRIWPGLLVMLALTVCVLGPWMTTQPLSVYWTAKDTLKYIVFNATVFHHIQYFLPGVFEGNHLPRAVNGSLWTLVSEVRAYLILLATWWLAHQWAGQRAWRRLLLGLCLALWAVHLFTLNRDAIAQVASWCVHAANAGGLALEQTPSWQGVLTKLGRGTIEHAPFRLYTMFATGAVIYLFREHIRLSAAMGAVGLVLMGAATWYPPVFNYAYSLSLPWVVLSLAYLPPVGEWGRRVLLSYNRLGDYSYGMYIYAFPVQQTLAALNPGIDVGDMLAASTVVTLVLAVASWHGVEKPALRFKQIR